MDSQTIRKELIELSKNLNSPDARYGASKMATKLNEVQQD